MATNNAINLSASGVTGYDGAGTFHGSSVTEYSLLLGGSVGYEIASLGVATNGQLPIGSTGANPVLATLTGGTGVSIVNSAGAITINASGSGLTWTVVTGATQAAAVNHGYIANNAGTCVITLPSTSAVGSIVAVTGINNSTGWEIAQNSGNTIFFGTSTTTPGTTGYLESTNTYDAVYLLCVTANAYWVVLNSVGNITVF